MGKAKSVHFDTNSEHYYVTVTDDRLRLRHRVTYGKPIELCSLGEYKQRRKNQARFIIYDAPYAVEYPGGDTVLAKLQRVEDGQPAIEKYYGIKIPQEAIDLLVARLMSDTLTGGK